MLRRSDVGLERRTMYLGLIRDPDGPRHRERRPRLVDQTFRERLRQLIGWRDKSDRVIRRRLAQYYYLAGDG